MHPVLVLTWGWVHELVWVVAEQSILDVATAHTTGPWKEREMDTGAGLTAAWREMLGPLYSSGSNKKYRSWPEPCPRCAFWAGLWCPPALAEAVCALGMLISSPSWRQDCCLQSNQPGWTGPCPWNPPPSAQSPQSGSACFDATAELLLIEIFH